MRSGTPTPAPNAIVQPRQPKQAFQVIFVIAALLILPATLALRTVARPAILQAASDNPTPAGYTWSLLLFIIPALALVGWFARRSDLALARKAFWRTIAVLTPLGFALDLLFGNAFFTFVNRRATIGLGIPAVGGAIPIEEFAFYLSGFMLVLLSYIWADEWWMAAYNVPDYKAEARGLQRLARFHFPSVLLGAGLIALAVICKKVWSPSPAGLPWYFIYLTAAAIVPAAGFFHTAQPFINWRAFSFTFFLILLISLLWEVTLAIPYGWWDYRPATMMGLTVGAWWHLPIEAVCVWLAVSFTTIITYEIIKIWQALGTGAWEALFGIKTQM